MDLEALNKKNDFVNRTKILKSFEDMIISKTEDNKTCIDVINGDNVLAISLDRNSEFIKNKRYTIDLSERHDHFPSYENPYRDTSEELRKVSYAIQLSIDGLPTEVQKVSADVWFGDGKLSGSKERAVESGITESEKRQIGYKLTGHHSSVWYKFVPTREDLYQRENNRQSHQDVINAAMNDFLSKVNK